MDLLEVRKRVKGERIMLFSPNAVFPSLLKATLRTVSTKKLRLMIMMGTQMVTMPAAAKKIQ